ncbi:MAG TPA: hypothetical protein DEB31_06310 [Clostridiales bacterium]|nr:hypothetical protein [Clostridiales bacterium]
MKKFLWIAVLCAMFALALLGCADQNQNQETASVQPTEQEPSTNPLAGEWHYADAMLERMSALDVGEEVLAVLKSTVMVFNEDGTVLIKTINGEQTGNYTMGDGYVALEQDGQTMHLDIDGDVLSLSGDPYFERG